MPGRPRWCASAAGSASAWRPARCGHLDGRDSACDVVLDVGWLLDVWGRGLATLDGDLVLALDGDLALVVDWQLAPDPGAVPRATARWTTTALRPP